MAPREALVRPDREGHFALARDGIAAPGQAMEVPAWRLSPASS